MPLRSPARLVALGLGLLLVVGACTSDADDADSADTDGLLPTGAVDVGLFLDGALAEEPTTAACTLSDGTETSCVELTVAGFPANRDSIGPWCPETTTDDAAGIWFDGDAEYDIDGRFILDLAEIYGDSTWMLYDEDGNVLSTDTSDAFNELVNGGDPGGVVNLCVYGEIEWVDGGEPIASTVEIPATPVEADSPTAVTGNIGVTLDGVVIANSAPIDLILGSYSIGAFDPCGGHVNPQEGYHLHATTGCSDVTTDVVDGETAIFGYALDGYAIHAPFDEGAEPETALDECNGHTTDELGYHYHANSVEQNAVLTCFHGVAVEAAGGPGGGGPPDGGQPPGG